MKKRRKIEEKMEKRKTGENEWKKKEKIAAIYEKNDGKSSN